MPWTTILLIVLLILKFVTAIALVMFEHHEPKSALAWMLVVFFVPFVGIILYLVLGKNLRKARFAKKARDDTQHLNPLLDQQKEAALKGELQFADERTAAFEGMVRLNLFGNNATYSEDNDLELLTHGTDKFKALLADLKAAKQFIHMQYYIIRDDELGNKVRDLLVAKAKQGVEVKILYDGLGSFKLPKSFFQPLKEAGGQICAFFPLSRLQFITRVNFRNHRKILVIDSKIAYMGGFNIGDEYIDDSKDFFHWRDLHCRFRGSAVEQLHMRFLLDWSFASRTPYTLAKRKHRQEEPMGKIGIQIVASGPDSTRQSIKHGYLRLINSAKHHVYIQSPYLIPDDSTLDALKIASLSGIDVRIVLPKKPDHPFVLPAAMSYVGELLKAGVRFYFYDKGFIHSKMITVDGYASSVGTANFDIRSFGVNFEVNAFIFDAKVAAQLEELFYRDMADSQEMTLEEFAKRSKTEKVKSALARLLSPLL